jgi:transcriptional regulator with PAS, ATPase and Fis domain
MGLSLEIVFLEIRNFIAMDYLENFEGAVTISDLEGTIIYLNEKAISTFKNDGGRDLIGKNLKDCHGEKSNEIIRQILATKKKNVYTIEKKGRKKLIFQAPWYKGSEISGLVELSLEIPFEMPHFNRDL